MCGVALSLDQFWERYSPRGPLWTPPDDEKRALGDIRFLETAPAWDVNPGTVPKVAGGGVGTYLWVIDDRGIHYVLDENKPELGELPPKHTNLTGGGMAYVGGEMWFETDSVLCISGDSGRYRSENAVQLEDAAAVFRSFGYRVRSLGWDDEANAPQLVWEES